MASLPSYMLSAVFATIVCLLPGAVSQCSDGKVKQLYAHSVLKSFSSPNFPRKYPANSNCRWLITAPNDGYRLRIDTLRMDMEPTVRCQYDNVTFYDGNTTSSKMLRRFCAGYYTEITNGRHLLVVFQSDHTMERPGFLFRYFAIAITRPTPITTTASTTTPQVEDKWLNTGALIGGVVGGVAFVIILGLVCGRCLSSSVPRQPPVHRPAAFYHSHAPPVTPLHEGAGLPTAVHMVQNNNSLFMISQAMGGHMPPFGPMDGGTTNMAFDNSPNGDPNSPMGAGMASLGVAAANLLAPPIGIPPPSYDDSMLSTHPPSIPPSPTRSSHFEYAFPADGMAPPPLYTPRDPAAAGRATNESRQQQQNPTSAPPPPINQESGQPPVPSAPSVPREAGATITTTSNQEAGPALTTSATTPRENPLSETPSATISSSNATVSQRLLQIPSIQSSVDITSPHQQSPAETLESGSSAAASQQMSENPADTSPSAPQETQQTESSVLASCSPAQQPDPVYATHVGMPANPPVSSTSDIPYEEIQEQDDGGRGSLRVYSVASPETDSTLLTSPSLTSSEQSSPAAGHRQRQESSPEAPDQSPELNAVPAEGQQAQCVDEASSVPSESSNTNQEPQSCGPASQAQEAASRDGEIPGDHQSVERTESASSLPLPPPPQYANATDDSDPESFPSPPSPFNADSDNSAELDSPELCSGPEAEHDVEMDINAEVDNNEEMDNERELENNDESDTCRSPSDASSPTLPPSSPFLDPGEGCGEERFGDPSGFSPLGSPRLESPQASAFDSLIPLGADSSTFVEMRRSPNLVITPSQENLPGEFVGRQGEDTDGDGGLGLDANRESALGATSLSCQSSPLLMEKQLRNSTSFPDIAEADQVASLRKEAFQRADSH